MKGFDVMLSTKIDDVMKKVVGESASELIYQFMEKQVSLMREEVGKNIDAFQAYLERIIGTEGVQIILSISLKELCRELKREYEEVENYFSFLDELYEMKFKILSSSFKEDKSVYS
jgi:hypothetical protein